MILKFWDWWQIKITRNTITGSQKWFISINSAFFSTISRGSQIFWTLSTFHPSLMRLCTSISTKISGLGTFGQKTKVMSGKLKRKMGIKTKSMKKIPNQESMHLKIQFHAKKSKLIDYLFICFVHFWSLLVTFVHFSFYLFL